MFFFFGYIYKTRKIFTQHVDCCQVLSTVNRRLSPVDNTQCSMLHGSLVTGYSSSQQASPLRELTCHMGSHSATCHPAEVTFPPLPQPIKAGTRFSDPRGMQGWVDLRVLWVVFLADHSRRKWSDCRKDQCESHAISVRLAAEWHTACVVILRGCCWQLYFIGVIWACYKYLQQYAGRLSETPLPAVRRYNTDVMRDSDDTEVCASTLLDAKDQLLWSNTVTEFI